MAEVSDEELIRRTRAGDRLAYGELVERYRPAVLRRAQAILRDPVAAEDAAQEAFVRAYTYLDSYDGHHRLYTWLARIVTNVCLSQLSAQQWQMLPLEQAVVLPSESLASDDPELAALASEQVRMLRMAIAGLPAKYRNVLILRYWYDLAYDDIARLTAQSLGAVKTQIRRARLLLAEKLRLHAVGYEWG
ncbi:MAG: sigma-70 family RNA polymerase sigma factor [Chloroflexi bacterium]|nr:sigma-70 family RNA polymerase sigma factor [Chloroflexota bacterium]HLG52186.1 sigma-70 family RNA polymerase sigma factor [Chloroflexota bacterium]